MFPKKAQDDNKETIKIEKQFVGFDELTGYLWWKEEVSYLFISSNQITEIKIVGAANNSFNVYARIDLKDRFEYFLIDNKKTLTTAKKLSEDFIRMIHGKKKEIDKNNKSKESEKNIEIKGSEEIKNGFEALIELAKDLKK